MRKYGLHRLILILLLTLIGCTAAVNNSITHIKTSDNYRIHTMNIGRYLTGGEKKIFLTLNPQVISDPDGNLSYNLIVEEKAIKDQFMEMGEKKSLILVIDDVQYSFKDASWIPLFLPSEDANQIPLLLPNSKGYSFAHRHKVIQRGFINERVCFSIELDVIEKIANAQKVEVIILGTDDIFEKQIFTPVYYEYFKGFLEYVHDKIETKK